MNANAALTRRQAEVAEFIGWGATKKEVANHLHISVRTVENTVRNIYEKIGVTKVNELSAWYFCKKFNISFELSPLKRMLCALSLLLIFLTYDFSPKSEFLLILRGRSKNIEETMMARPVKRDNYRITA